MSQKDKPQVPENEPRMEKQYMDQPQEEYVHEYDEGSKDVSEVPKEKLPPDKQGN